MKSVLTPIVLALLLLAAGSVSWMLGQSQEQLAGLKAQVLSMDYGAVANEAEPADSSLSYAARVPTGGRLMSLAAREDRARANYWLGRYEALAVERDLGGSLVERDPELLLIAANAAYRANRYDPTDRRGYVEKMAAVVTNYADVLKNSPDLVDAAYNYEYTSRLRNSVEKGGKPPAPPDAKNQPAIHGRPGGPPKGVEPSKFNIIVPKSGDERTDSPEAGQGQKKIRKG